MEFVREQFLSGVPVTEIAKTLGVDRSTISRKLKQHKIYKPAINIEAVINQIRSGMSLRDIAASLTINRMTLSAKLKKLGLDKKLITFNEHFFHEVDDEQKAYWLGFIMADGCVSRTHRDKLAIVAAIKDAHHLLKWHKAINSSLRLYDRGDGAVTSQHYSTAMCNDLERYGCVPRKSLILQFPEINERLLHHFVRGYFDGDGSVGLKNKKQATPQLRVSFVGTANFLESLSLLIGTTNVLRPTGNNKLTKCLEIAGNKKAQAIYEWMYKDATVWLERKREVFDSTL